MNQDTIKLLKECNAGCKSATNSMEQVIPFINDEKFKSLIDNYNNKHIQIGDECHLLLNKVGEDEEDPKTTAKIFSWVSTELKLMVNDDIHKIADIMVDGCNMGIKSLSKYLNQYASASLESISLVKRLIILEKEFMNELLAYL